MNNDVGDWLRGANTIFASAAEAKPGGTLDNLWAKQITKDPNSALASPGLPSAPTNIIDLTEQFKANALKT